MFDRLQHVLRAGRDRRGHRGHGRLTDLSIDLTYRVSYMTYEVRRDEGRSGADVSSMLLTKEVEVAGETRVREPGGALERAVLVRPAEGDGRARRWPPRRVSVGPTWVTISSRAPAFATSPASSGVRWTCSPSRCRSMSASHRNRSASRGEFGERVAGPAVPGVREDAPCALGAQPVRLGVVRDGPRGEPQVPVPDGVAVVQGMEVEDAAQEAGCRTARRTPRAGGRSRGGA